MKDSELHHLPREERDRILSERYSWYRIAKDSAEHRAANPEKAAQNAAILRYRLAQLRGEEVPVVRMNDADRLALQEFIEPFRGAPTGEMGRVNAFNLFSGNTGKPFPPAELETIAYGHKPTRAERREVRRRIRANASL